MWIKNKYGSKRIKEVVTLERITTHRQSKKRRNAHKKKQREERHVARMARAIIRRVINFKKEMSSMLYNEKIKQLREIANLIFPNRISYSIRRKKWFYAEGICEVCKSFQSTCQHHLVMLKNGGSNKPWNRIQICEECHCLIHDWIKPRENKIIAILDSLTREYLEIIG